MAERQCAHEACACAPDAGEEHCGPLCQIAARAPEGTFPKSYCPCGHPTCRPEHVPADQPPRQAQPKPF